MWMGMGGEGRRWIVRWEVWRGDGGESDCGG